MYVPVAAMGEYAKQGDSLDREWSGLLQRWGSQGGLGRQSGLGERQLGSLGRQSSRGQMGRQPSFPSGYVVVEENQSREHLTRQSSKGQMTRQSSKGQLRTQSLRDTNVSESHDQSVGTKVSNGNLNRQTYRGQLTKQTSKGQPKEEASRKQTNSGSAQKDARRSRSKSATRRSRSKSSSPSRLFASTASSRAKHTDASTGTTKAPSAKKSFRISRSTNRSQSISKSLRPKSTSPTRARQPIEANSSAVPRRRSSSDDWRNASCDEEEGPLASYLSFKQFAANKRQNQHTSAASGSSQQSNTPSINKYKKTSHSHQSSILANKSYELSATQSSSFGRKISDSEQNSYSTNNRSSISSNFERSKSGSSARPYSVSSGSSGRGCAASSGRSFSASGSNSTVTRQKKSASPVNIALSTLKEAKVTPSGTYNRGSTTNFQQRMTSSSSFKRKSVSSTFIG